jgi:hypothetical protein
VGVCGLGVLLFIALAWFTDDPQGEVNFWQLATGNPE